MIRNTTYYDVLEVTDVASADEIKQSYRRLIKTWHPDLHPGDEEAEAKTQEINEAYDVLSDPEKRAKYDEYLSLTRPFDPEDEWTEDIFMQEERRATEAAARYGGMSFKEYCENIVKEAGEAKNDKNSGKSSKFNEARYKEYSEKRKILDTPVKDTPLFGVIIAGIFITAFLYLNKDSMFPADTSKIAFPIVLVICALIIVLMQVWKHKNTS